MVCETSAGHIVHEKRDSVVAPPWTRSGQLTGNPTLRAVRGITSGLPVILAQSWGEAPIGGERVASTLKLPSVEIGLRCGDAKARLLQYSYRPRVARR
jgi:hypothetical protein